MNPKLRFSDIQAFNAIIKDVVRIKRLYGRVYPLIPYIRSVDEVQSIMFNVGQPNPIEFFVLSSGSLDLANDFIKWIDVVLPVCDPKGFPFFVTAARTKMGKLLLQWVDADKNIFDCEFVRELPSGQLLFRVTIDGVPTDKILNPDDKLIARIKKPPQ